MTLYLSGRSRLVHQFWSGFLKPVHAYRSGVIGRLYDVARRCVERNNNDLAILAWKIVLALDPADAEASSLISNRYVELGLLDEAKHYLKRRLAQNSRDLNARINLANLCMAPFDPETAEELLRTAAAIDPDNSRLLQSTALLHRIHSRLGDSNDCLETLFDRAGYDCEMKCVYAQNLIDQGRTDAAIPVLEEAVRIHPSCPGAYSVLASLRYYKEREHPDITHIHHLLNEGGLPRHSVKVFHYTLCNIYDFLGQWDEAFSHATKFNELVEFACDIGQSERFSKRLLSAFDKAFISAMLERNASRLSVGRNLVFIVGMPRSGSTLTEQILSSHPEVTGGGERNEIPALALSLRKVLGRRHKYPECVGQINLNQVDRIAFGHLEKISRETRSGGLFVDKNLSNYMYIGLISLLFPGAKIVHCKRNPLDTCLSCYFQNFDFVTFAHDLALLGRMYKVYLNVMDHWRAHLGSSILDVQYEDLVSNPREIVRHLLDHCGLPFDQRCLDFHKTQRVANTASSIQVKSPIYASSVDRWKNYRRHLQPLIDVLEI